MKLLKQKQPKADITKKVLEVKTFRGDNESVRALLIGMVNNADQVDMKDPELIDNLEKAIKVLWNNNVVFDAIGEQIKRQK